MDPTPHDFVRKHYEVPELPLRVQELLGAGPWDWRELAEVDQFHVMGSEATSEIAQRLGVSSDTRFLDVGCGFGGPARFLVGSYGASVTGVDLSPDFVAVAGWLAERTGLHASVRFLAADATRLPFDASTFDAAWTLHVGMNVSDKVGLYSEIKRVLVPGGRLAVFDFVCGSGEPTYPLPWAKDPGGSFLATENQLDQSLQDAGLSIETAENWSEKALSWLDRTRTQPRPSQPNLVSLVFGSDAKLILQNLARGLASDQIRLVLRIAVR